MISLYKRPPNLKWRENDWYHLVPFGDIHRGSPEHDEHRYEKFLDRAVERKDTLVVGLGDYEEMMSTSEREHWRKKDWHHGTLLDYEQHIISNIDEHTKLLLPLAKTGRLLGLCEGHHYYEFQYPEIKVDKYDLHGKTSTEYLCHKLGVPYLGYQFLMTVGVPNTRKGTHDLKFKVWGNHGKGGSGQDKGMNILRTTARSWDADIFLMGHNHRKAVDRDTVGDCQARPSGDGDCEVSWHHRIRGLARTGGFCRTYSTSGRASYGERGAFSPADLGVINVALCWKREQSRGADRTWLDLHLSL